MREQLVVKLLDVIREIVYETQEYETYQDKARHIREYAKETDQDGILVEFLAWFD